MLYRNLFIYVILFVFGAFAYSSLEILWRGFTHWTMALAGGFCLVLIYMMNNTLTESPLIFRSILSGGIITVVEFSIGCIVNIALEWGVWDYSDRNMNLMGQICLTYSVLWILVSIPVIFACDWVNKNVPI